MPRLFPVLLRGSGPRAWRRIVLGVGGLIILAIWAAVGVSIVTARQAKFNEIQTEGRNLMISFRKEVAALLGGVDRELQSIAGQMRRDGDNFDLYRWGQENIHVFPGMVTSIVGADGWLRAMTREPDAGSLYLGDRDHVQVHRQRKIGGLYIGQTVIMRSTGEPALPISRRLEGEDGRLLGVLSVLIDPGSLTTLHRSINLGGHGVMSLIGLDRVIRARFTAGNSDGTQGVGTTLEEGRLPAAIEVGGEGWYVKRSVVDAVDRVYNHGRVGEYPLIVSVGLGLEEELAAADAQDFVIIALALTATGLLVGLAVYLIRQDNIREQHEIALAEERVKLECANLQLSESRDRAEAASQAKSQFLANMSHELRTPLNAVIGYSQMIRDEVLGPDARRQYREYAGDVLDSGQHLLGLINEILDTAKIEAGKMRLIDDEIWFPEIINCSIGQLRPAVERKGIRLGVKIADGLPAVRGDAGRLVQIMANLLSNAVKFTPEDGEIGVVAECSAAGELVCTIRDSGIGMSADEVAIALEPFAQVEDGLSRRYQGTGLGLPLAKRLVELHGGDLTIVSVKHLGTSVRFRLPAERTIPLLPEDLLPEDRPANRVAAAA